jgi:beta-1,4-mannosyl-glycoprotein beta-1,4-N-acetylglucosaminyltransferase
MKIIDSFLFFNELSILDLRLNILNNYVDKFVIVESTKTHSGINKELIFEKNKHLFQNFLNKIEYIVYDPDKPYLPWENENNQRRKIIDGLQDCLCDDIIFLSDVDEIPNPEKIQFIKNAALPSYHDSILSMKQYLSYYYLNYIDKQIATSDFNSKCFYYNTLQCFYDNDIQKIRNEKNVMIVEDGGWHFSFLGGKDKIREKLESYAHQEYNNDNIKNNIESVIESGNDLFNRNEYKFEKKEINDLIFPEYIINNKEELINKGLIKI